MSDGFLSQALLPARRREAAGSPATNNAADHRPSRMAHSGVASRTRSRDRMSNSPSMRSLSGMEKDSGYSTAGVDLPPTTSLTDDDYVNNFNFNNNDSEEIFDFPEDADKNTLQNLIESYVYKPKQGLGQPKSDGPSAWSKATESKDASPFLNEQQPLSKLDLISPRKSPSKMNTSSGSEGECKVTIIDGGKILRSKRFEPIPPKSLTGNNLIFLATASNAVTVYSSSFRWIVDLFFGQ